MRMEKLTSKFQLALAEAQSLAVRWRLYGEGSGRRG